jgi:hypothetical protein
MTTARNGNALMHRITKADIVISVGRGLIMAAAIVGATYYLGNWYFGGDGLDSLFRNVDDRITAQFDGTIVPTTEATR